MSNDLDLEVNYLQPAIYIAIFLPLFFSLIHNSRNKQVMIKQLIKSKKSGGSKQMLEFAKKFINKECLIYTFNSQITGVIKEVSDGAILIENKSTIEVVNLDYITRIREYPKGKNGKKNAFILD
ncbi:DUF6897 domain-containing protein [Anaerosporobacter sp.]